MHDLELTDGELRDLFICQLPPKPLVSLIQTRKPWANQVFKGFRENTASLKAPLVRQQIGRLMDMEHDFQQPVIMLWELDHRELLEKIAGCPERQIAVGLTALASEYGGACVYFALRRDSRKSVIRLAEKNKALLLSVPQNISGRVPANAGADAKDSGAYKKYHNNDNAHVKDLAEKVKHLRKHYSEQEQRVKAALRTEQQAKASEAKVRAKNEELTKELDRRKKQIDTNLQEISRLQHDLDEANRTLKNLWAILTAPASDLAIRPSSDVPWYKAVESLLEVGSYDESHAFLTALVLCSEDPAPHELLAKLYHEIGRIESEKIELIWLARNRQKISVSDSLGYAFRALTLDQGPSDAVSVVADVFAGTDLRNARRVSDIASVVLQWKDRGSVRIKWCGYLRQVVILL